MSLVRAILRSPLEDLTVVSYGGPDVGLLCVYWAEPGDETLPLGAAPTVMPGFPGRAAITRAYADARVQRIYGGTNEIMKEVITRAMGLGGK